MSVSRKGLTLISSKISYFLLLLTIFTFVGFRSFGANGNEVRRVLFLYASVGKGHEDAARGALADLKAKCPGCIVEIIDINQPEYMAPGKFEMLMKYYNGYMLEHPDLFDAAYRIGMGVMGDQRFFTSVGNLPGTQVYLPDKLLPEILRFKPDAVLSTFPMCHEMMVNLRNRGLYNGPLFWKHTDRIDETYYALLARESTVAFVDSRRIAKAFKTRGVPNVVASGMAMDLSVYDETPESDIIAFRQKFNVVSGVPTVLITGGGLGLGDMPAVAKSIFKEFSGQPVQIIMICGKNEENFAKANAMKATLEPNHHLVVTPLIEPKEVYAAMSLPEAKVLYGKPGGLTIGQGIAKKLGIVCFNKIKGMETYNIDDYEREGYLLQVKKESEAGVQVHELMTNKRMLNAQLKAHEKFIKEQNAGIISDMILDPDTVDPEHVLGKFKPILTIGDAKRPWYFKCIEMLNGAKLQTEAIAKMFKLGQ